MKKFLAMWIGALLLFSAQAKADSCPAGKYWNSVEKTCAYATACISPTEVVYKSKQYKLNNDGSFKTNDDGTLVYEEFYESTYTCGNCEKGFSKMWIKYASLTKWIVQCKSCPSGCKECNSYYPGSDPLIQITTCTVCKSGYTLSNGKCVSGSESESESEGGMVSCPVGQYLSGKKCVDCSTIPVQNGICRACTSGSSCDAVQCANGYKTDGTTCVKTECPENCAACDSWGFCYRCNDRYMLSEDRLSCTCGNGYAPLNGGCEEICQYQVNLEGGVCEKYCAGTVGSSSQLRRMCLYAKCFNGSEPKSTKATYGGENISHRYCCPENCLDCSDWGQCTRCYAGYVLENGVCVNCPSNCSSCLDGSTCTVCNDGYVLENGICVASCRNFVKLEGGTCEKYCIHDYGEECLSALCDNGSPPRKKEISEFSYSHYYCCPENCADCSDWGQCTSCNDGYTLTNGSCVMAAPSCTDGQYADSTGKCQLCSNISVTNGTCSACSSDGTCTNATCDKGYAYNASTSACTPVVTCKPPLKFSADYSGDCDGCCVE